jgi:cell division protein FtsB
MRWVMGLLLTACVGLQGQLWLTEDGHRKTRDLHAAVAAQRLQNQQLHNRNGALEAEVLNLKQRREAAEERARSNLGMIGRSETFYQVVPASDSASSR